MSSQSSHPGPQLNVAGETIISIGLQDYYKCLQEDQSRYLSPPGVRGSSGRGIAAMLKSHDLTVMAGAVNQLYPSIANMQSWGAS